MDLITLPLDERARRLHLKALALKRVVSTWSEKPPHEANRKAACEALEALRLDVLDLQSTTSEVRLRSAYAGSSPAAKTRR